MGGVASLLWTDNLMMVAESTNTATLRFCGAACCAALYQRVCELDPAAAAAAEAGGAAAAAAASGSGNAFDGGVAHKGEALLCLLAELEITPESYSGHLQPLLMDVSVKIAGLCCIALWQACGMSNALQAPVQMVAVRCLRCCTILRPLPTKANTLHGRGAADVLQAVQ